MLSDVFNLLRRLLGPGPHPSDATPDASRGQLEALQRDFQDLRADFMAWETRMLKNLKEQSRLVKSLAEVQRREEELREEDEEEEIIPQSDLLSRTLRFASGHQPGQNGP